VTIGIKHVKDYILIRFVIRFERKFPIRRSLYKPLQNHYGQRQEQMENWSSWRTRAEHTT